jgi:histone H3/H4
MENTAIEVETTENASEGAVLVVTSKVKKFIKENYGFNTAGDVPEALTTIVVAALNKASASAKDAGRKTIMARDFTA